MSARALAHTPIFGLKSPYRSVQYQDGRVLRGLCGKTPQKQGHKYQRIFLGGLGCLPSLQGPLNFVQNSIYWAKCRCSKGEGRHPTPQEKILRYL